MHRVEPDGARATPRSAHACVEAFVASRAFRRAPWRRRAAAARAAVLLVWEGGGREACAVLPGGDAIEAAAGAVGQSDAVHYYVPLLDQRDALERRFTGVLWAWDVAPGSAVTPLADRLHAARARGEAGAAADFAVLQGLWMVKALLAALGTSFGPAQQTEPTRALSAAAEALYALGEMERTPSGDAADARVIGAARAALAAPR